MWIPSCDISPYLQALGSDLVCPGLVILDLKVKTSEFWFGYFSKIRLLHISTHADRKIWCCPVRMYFILWKRLFLFLSLVWEVSSLKASMFLFWHGICLVPFFDTVTFHIMFSFTGNHSFAFFNFHTWYYISLKTCLFCVLWELIPLCCLHCIAPLSHGWSGLKQWKDFYYCTPTYTLVPQLMHC